MADDSLVSGLIDPLSAFNGPSLFPRTFRAAVGDAATVDSEDLDSINQFLMSLEFRSPKKLVNEAKKILEGGTEFLDSNLVSFAKNINISDAIAVKGKDMPKEKRKGLGLTRNRAPFSLKTSVSQPSVSMEPTLNIDQLADPDEFFDAYERLENAKKEIQKQLGGKMDNINEYKPSTNTRLRRTGILGKNYTYKHRYSSVSFENDVSISSQEAEEHNIPNAPRDDPQQKLLNADPNLDIDLEGVEFVASAKKSGTEVENVLDELLSCDDEDLDGDGALILLQERLKIKPLDLENLRMPEFDDIQRSAIFSAAEIVRKPGRKSSIIDNVLKNANGKQSVDQEQMAKNLVVPVASPTPPRSPFASLSLLQKRILQSNPMKDSFSPLNVELSAHRSAFPVDPIDKLHEQIDGLTGLRKTGELEPHMEAEITEPIYSNIDAQNVIGSTDDIPSQFIDENTLMQITEPDPRSNVDPDYDNEGTTNIENLNDDQSNSSVHEDGSMDATSTRQQFGTAEQLEVRQMKLQRQKREAGDKHLKKLHPPRKSLAVSCTSFETGVRQSKRTKMSPLEYEKDETFSVVHVNDNKANTSVLEVEAMDASSRRQQFDAAKQPEVHRTKQKRRRGEAGHERLRKSHPPRKSLAESGTSFETGVRRSKRIKMRPLEYWKGERFLFGRVDDSFKLIGVKYFSPGKGDANLKVKPFIRLNLSKYKDLLDLAARH